MAKEDKDVAEEQEPAEEKKAPAKKSAAKKTAPKKTAPKKTASKKGGSNDSLYRVTVSYAGQTHTNDVEARLPAQAVEVVAGQLAERLGIAPELISTDQILRNPRDEEEEEEAEK